MILENRKTGVDINEIIKKHHVYLSAICYLHMFLVIFLNIYSLYFYVIDLPSQHSFHNLFLQETRTLPGGSVITFSIVKRTLPFLSCTGFHSFLLCPYFLHTPPGNLHKEIRIGAKSEVYFSANNDWRSAGGPAK